MTTKLANKVIATLTPELQKRIKELSELIDSTDDLDELVLAKESVFNLLKDNGSNSRLKGLLQKVKIKIRTNNGSSV